VPSEPACALSLSRNSAKQIKQLTSVMITKALNPNSLPKSNFGI